MPSGFPWSTWVRIQISVSVSSFLLLLVQSNEQVYDEVVSSLGIATWFWDHASFFLMISMFPAQDIVALFMVSDDGTGSDDRRSGLVKKALQHGILTYLLQGLACYLGTLWMAHQDVTFVWKKGLGMLMFFFMYMLGDQVSILLFAE